MPGKGEWLLFGLERSVLSWDGSFVMVPLWLLQGVWRSDLSRVRGPLRALLSLVVASGSSQNRSLAKLGSELGLLHWERQWVGSGFPSVSIAPEDGGEGSAGWWLFSLSQCLLTRE